MSGFSKVDSAKIVDDDDDRDALFQRALGLYAAAESTYYDKNSAQNKLRLFDEAEASLAPLLATSDLMGLRPRELEAVLKGRLHRAALLAQQEDQADRWSKVRSLTAQVLQFDSRNCHARWLHGAALFHGFHLLAEAREEMERAVTSARERGNKEADLWRTEIDRIFAAQDAAEAATDVARKTSDADGETSGGNPALRRGFFNQAASARAKARTVPTIRPETRGAGGAKTPEVSEASRERENEAKPVPASAVDQVREQEELLQQQRVRRDQLQERVSALERDIASLREEEEMRRIRRTELLEGLEGCGTELAQCGSHFSFDGPIQDLWAAATQTSSHFRDDKKWTETEQQALRDLATEVLTVRQLCSRESRARQDASREQVSDARSVARRFGEMKATSKALREVSVSAETPIPDVSGSFGALPSGVKLTALLQDGAALRLSALVCGMGMLFTAGMANEVARRLGGTCAL